MRPLTQKDFSWCHAICAKAYPGEWDAVDGELWFTEILRREDYYLARGDHSVLVGAVGRLPYKREKIVANMKMLASDGSAGFETVTIVKSFMAWAKKNGASYLKFDSPDYVDFAPLARRVGAKPHGPSYAMDL